MNEVVVHRSLSGCHIADSNEAPGIGIRKDWGGNGFAHHLNDDNEWCQTSLLAVWLPLVFESPVQFGRLASGALDCNRNRST
jgi:hypothetical protein